MIRDENLLESILIAAEACNSVTFYVFQLRDQMEYDGDPDVFYGHMRLLVDDGLFEIITEEDGHGQISEMYRLTSQGHDHLKN